MSAEQYEHLEARVTALEYRVNHELPAEIGAIGYGVGLVHADTQAILTQLRGVNQRLDRHAAELGNVNTRLDRQGETLAQHGEILAQHGQRLDSIDGRLDSIDTRLDGHDQRLDSIDTRLDRHGEMLTEILRRLPPASGEDTA